MPDISPEYRVASGPTAGTDWCVLESPPLEFVAPGGVVLCVEKTRTPHRDAKRAADSAWAILRRWHGQRTTVIDVELPPVAPGRAPAPPLDARWCG